MLSAIPAQLDVAVAWRCCSGVLALGALFRGLENLWRFRPSKLRCALAGASLSLAGWVLVSTLQGDLAGAAWVGLCLVGTAESVLAKGLEQGGSDPMTLWMRAFVATAAWSGAAGQQVLCAVCAGVLLASYVCAGLGKAGTRSWWNGRAIEVYLARPCYTIGQSLSAPLSGFGYQCLGIAVLGFELLAPAVLISSSLLWMWAVVGVMFHALNILFFGLHRFFWTWIAAYPLLFSL